MGQFNGPNGVIRKLYDIGTTPSNPSDVNTNILEFNNYFNTKSSITECNLYQYKCGYREINYGNNNTKKLYIDPRSASGALIDLDEPGASISPANDTYYKSMFNTITENGTQVMYATLCSNSHWSDVSSHFNDGYHVSGSQYTGYVYFLGEFKYIDATDKEDWWMLLKQDVTSKYVGDIVKPIWPFTNQGWILWDYSFEEAFADRY